MVTKLSFCGCGWRSRCGGPDSSADNVNEPLSNVREGLPWNSRAVVLAILTVVVFATSPVRAGSCGECTRMESDGRRSCSAIREADKYNYCIRQVVDAAGRCWRICTNYNGVGPTPRD